MRFIPIILLAVVIVLVSLDRAGAFGYRGDDWARFDRQSVRAIEVLSGDEFVVDGKTTVHLLGVDAPDSAAHWNAQAKQYLTARLKDRPVTLRLDGTQTRDDSGALRAYVYITDGDLLNADIIRDGQAFADRRTKHTLRGPIEQGENEARKKKRGLWKEMTDDQMPAWRLEWLRNRRR